MEMYLWLREKSLLVFVVRSFLGYCLAIFHIDGNMNFLIYLSTLFNTELSNFDARLEMGARSGCWLYYRHETCWANAAIRSLHGPFVYWSRNVLNATNVQM